MNNKDKFGFYTVGNYKTYSKLEAIEYSAKIATPVEWNFNREYFSQFDWTQEPPGSLEFWYEQRARQIREQYDYIVIWYSGGADSHNVLMSFVTNNIFVDEIAQFHNLSGDHGNKKNYLNEEVFFASAPFSQQLIENNPVYQNTKHRLVDLTDLQLDLLTRDNNKWDYFYKVASNPSPNALARSYMREMVPDYQDLINQGKSVCFIFGAEKPGIEFDDNNWYTAFYDTISWAVSPRSQMLNRPWEHDELFYWSSDLPQIAIKQAHVVKRFLSQLRPELVDNVNVSSYDVIIDEYGRRVINNPCVDIKINQIRYQLLPDGLHRLIYPHWKPPTIVNEKPQSLAYSPRDSWMFSSNAPDIGQKYYNYGLLQLREKIKKINPNYWWEFKFDPKLKTPYSGGMKKLFNKYRIG
jgi:hypothetical protein